jgi:hypothetical protein
MKFTWHFTVDLCSSTPYENDVIAFDIWHHWAIKTPIPFTPGASHILKAESRFIDDDFNWHPITTFRLPGRHLKIGSGSRARRFLCSRSGSGGNWYWTSVGCPNRVTPYLFNHLRRRLDHKVDRTEWDTEFVDQIWDHPRRITWDILRDFTRRSIRAHIQSDPDLLALLKSQPSTLNPQPTTAGA